MSLFVNDDIYNELMSVENYNVLINGNPPNYYDTYQNPYTVEYVAVDGYIFDYVSGGGSYDPVNDIISPTFNVSSDGKKASAEFINSDFSPSTYTPHLIVGGSSYDITITEAFLNKVNEANGVLKIDGALANSGDEFNYPFLMEIVANSENVVFISSRGGYDVVNDSYQSFNISENKKTMTYRFTAENPFIADNWSFTSDILTPEVRGYNDVYLLTDAQVREIINSSYGKFINGGSNQPSEYVDYREYILGLLDIPFDIPESLKSGNSNIKLGNLETGVNATVLNDDQLTIDMGSITYSVNEGNSYDFMGVSCKLHLPFSEPLAIEPHYIVNQTINIEYVINLVDGSTFINVHSDKINDVIISHKIDLHCDIPFRIQNINPSNNNAETVTYGNKNGVLTPYIEVLKNKTVLPYGFFTVPIVDETVINNVNGYLEVENINLKGNISNDDQQSLINLLRQGIINNV